MMRRCCQTVASQLPRTSKQSRAFNLPRSHVNPRYEEPRDKLQFLFANSVPLRVKVEATGTGADIQGQGYLNVGGDIKNQIQVSATADDIVKDFWKALLANIIWATDRAWQFEGNKLNGIKIDADDVWKPTTQQTITVRVAGEGDIQKNGELAKSTTTLLLPFADKIKVNYVIDASVAGNAVTPSDDFLIKGLATLLCCQQKKYIAATQAAKAAEPRAFEWDAEFEIDTRGFVAGAETIGITPKVKDVYFRTRVNSNASLDAVKDFGAKAQDTCLIFKGYSSNADNVATRWTLL